MKKTEIIAFMVGAVTGVASTMFYFKNKYAAKAEKAIAEAVDFYCGEDSEDCDSDEDDYIPEYQGMIKKPDLMSLAPLVDRKIIDYDKYSQVENQQYMSPKERLAKNQEEMEKHFEVSDFHVVENNEDLDFPDEYANECLVLYTDGILADSYGSIVQDVDYLVGQSNVNYFLNDADEIMYIQNDTVRTVYEITKDVKSYSDEYGNGGGEED